MESERARLASVGERGIGRSGGEEGAGAGAGRGNGRVLTVVRSLSLLSVEKVLYGEELRCLR